MEVLILLLIIFGLPVIIYFFIAALQWLGKNVNPKNKSGVLLIILMILGILYLAYYTKGILVALLIVLFLPFILFVLVDAESRVFSNNRVGYVDNTINTEKKETIIPFPVIIVSYILFFMAIIWMARNTSYPRLFGLIFMGGVLGLVQLVKKKRLL